LTRVTARRVTADTARGEREPYLRFDNRRAGDTGRS
jgi:hypothetical protein